MPRVVTLLLVIATLLLSGCAHLTHLDSAQENFNKGAGLENSIKLSTEVDPTISPSFYYSRANVSLDKALKGSGKNKLRKDHLLGHAYSLKALCAWKLGKTQEAISYSNAAKGRFLILSSQGIKMPRDLLLMRALPAIISIDTIARDFFEFRSSSASTEVEESLHFYHSYIFSTDSLPTARLQSALAEIELLKKEAGNNPELQSYLIMVQLSALKTWSGCLSMLFEKSIALMPMQEQLEARENILDEKQSYFNLRRDQLLRELEHTLEGEGSQKDKIIAYWKALM
jgi:hypothetical protein